MRDIFFINEVMASVYEITSILVMNEILVVIIYKKTFID